MASLPTSRIGKLFQVLYITDTCSGVASVSLRSLPIAAECLTDFKEQSEVLSILDKIQKETGWRVGFMKPELKKKWGWNEDYLNQQPPMPPSMQSPPMDYQKTQTTILPPPIPSPIPPPIPPPPQQQQIPRGIINPLMKTADFSGSTYPYQNYYVAPVQSHNEQHYFYGLIH